MENNACYEVNKLDEYRDQISDTKSTRECPMAYASYTTGAYKIDCAGGLTLVDPITQIARRIMGFFEKDPEVITVFHINNMAELEPGQDHLAELCIYVQPGLDHMNTEKADCISNFIRHRHIYPEYGFDGQVLRNHILNVRVFAVGAVDPNDPTQKDRVSECTFITDERSQVDSLKRELKFEMLKKAFKNNPNISGFKKYTSITKTVWYFIECERDPITIQEDNLTSYTGFKSELVETVLPLAFVVGDMQISTAVYV